MSREDGALHTTSTTPPAAFAILVGLALIAIPAWLWLSAGGVVPEPDAQPIQTIGHIAAEVATGLILILAGYGLLAHRVWSRKLYLIAIGLLLFAVINGVAHYGERQDMGFVLFYVALGVAAVFFAMRAEE